MSFKRSVVLAVAAAFAFFVPAQAAPKLMDAISAQDLAAMFNAHGIHATARINSKGVPTVDMDIVLHGKDQMHSQALLHDCHDRAGMKACRIILYYGFWHAVRPVPLAKINAYNSEYYLGKVSFQSEGTEGAKKQALVVTSQVSLAGGVTSDHIGASLYEWVHTVENVADKLNPKSYQ